VAGIYKAKNIRGVQVRTGFYYAHSDIDTSTITVSPSASQHLCVISTAISASTSFRTPATSTAVPSLFAAYTASHIWSNGSGIYGKRRAGRNATSLKRPGRSCRRRHPIEVVDAPQPVQTPSVDARRGFPANATREEVENFMDFWRMLRPLSL
jgi:hypothetical protein